MVLFFVYKHPTPPHPSKQGLIKSKYILPAYFGGVGWDVLCDFCEKKGGKKKGAMWIGSGTGLCSHRGSAECVPVGFIKGVPLKQTETHLQNPCDSKISFQNPAPLQLGEKKDAVGDEQKFSQILSQLLEHS